MVRPGSIPSHVPVDAQGFESSAIDTARFPFPPPLANRSSNPAGFAFWWSMLHFVFELPPPDTFPSFPAAAVRTNERRILDRYIRAAGELAESTILSGEDAVTVRFKPDGVEHVEPKFSSNEATRGFITLFRQLHTNEKTDPARFIRVREILKQVNERVSDVHIAERDRQVKAWAQARGQLLGANARVLTGRKLASEDRFPADAIPGADGRSSQELITGYQYGDLIHWGHGREVVEAVANDPFESAWQRMAFLEAVTGLGHAYIGFSLLVAQSLAADA
jgi:hypothetical protein